MSVAQIKKAIEELSPDELADVAAFLAKRDPAISTVLRQVMAGEEVCIRSGDTIVALRPLPVSTSAPDAASLPPREALRRLQMEARLTPAAADTYLGEVRAERFAADERGAA